MTTLPAGVEHPAIPVTRGLLTPVLREALGRLGPELGGSCGHQLGLADGRGGLTGSLGGKLIRPALTLLCATAAGAAAPDAVAPAAAVELMHNASLVHDDIMDGDTLRRGRPTVWARFGVAQAILAGDALIGLGFELLGGCAHPHAAAAVTDLARALRFVGIGQGQDISSAAAGTDDVLAMFVGKTGALFGSACRLGVTLSSAPGWWRDCFEEFGTRLGVAFQLADDVLDLVGDPASTGRPGGSDVRARRRSAPVVAALASGTRAGERLAELYLDDGDVDPAQVVPLVVDAGGLAWCAAAARTQAAAAWAALDGLAVPATAREALESLADGLLARGVPGFGAAVPQPR